MKKIKTILAPLLDIALVPFVALSAVILRGTRGALYRRLPLCKKTLLALGTYPLRDHYYDPLFHPRHITHPLSNNRPLPGIKWNTSEQLQLLDEFSFRDELSNTPMTKADELLFSFNNRAFDFNDAEYWYNIIRLKKPSVIIEIGSGQSTLMAIKAINQNRLENTDYQCRHICIEPYESAWLEKTQVEVIRDKVENVDVNLFSQLGNNDILFIDSSHMIRPQGDVLTEYLEILPLLNEGVIVHVHDIYSPKDYPEELLLEKVRFWNEQYLLEAFLTCNKEWKIICALNFLGHEHPEKLQEKFLHAAKQMPGQSFYIQKIVKG